MSAIFRKIGSFELAESNIDGSFVLLSLSSESSSVKLSEIFCEVVLLYHRHYFCASSRRSLCLGELVKKCTKCLICLI